MLKIISPTEQNSYRAAICLLLGMMKCEQAVSLTGAEKEVSTFILGEATAPDTRFLREGDIYGGAFLCKRDINDLPPSFQNILAGEKEVWMGSVTLFINPLMTSLATGEDGCQIFYQELRAKFCEFGKKSEIQYLYLTLSPAEYRYTKQKGLWAYDHEVSPEDSSDGLFHGILALSSAENARNKALFEQTGPFLKAA